MKYVIALVLALSLNAAANLLMKTGAQALAARGGLLADGPAAAVGKILTTPALLIGLICFGLNAGFYMFALQSKQLKISIAYPIMVGGGFAVIAVLAYVLPHMKERLTSIQWGGVVLVLAGIMIIATQSDRQEIQANTPQVEQQEAS
ncbi:MAG: hypothetical protein ACPGXK_03190 [Phycisphaerae bacterium]